MSGLPSWMYWPFPAPGAGKEKTLAPVVSEVASPTDTSIKEAAERESELIRRKKKKGLAGTIATSPLGLGSSPDVLRKTLGT